jgi:hypothetical protein
MAEYFASDRPESQSAIHRLNAAHHRFASASATLARVNRLLAPPVPLSQQINIATAGAQQLNLASSDTTPAPPEVD